MSDRAVLYFLRYPSACRPYTKPSLLLQLTTTVDNNDNNLDANVLFNVMSTPFSPLTASIARFYVSSRFFLPFFLCHLHHEPHNVA
ncbi:uncharacterized protein DS421_1g28670 [Arachis hypogaea]|nr:uncharacterized protein DS421_1g28670 [Arachis hypogaea]